MIKFKTSVLLLTNILLSVSIIFFSCSSNTEKTAKKNSETTTINAKKDATKSKQERQNKIRESLKKVLGDKYDIPIKEATEKQILKGAEVYQLKCAKCHGGFGKGDGPDGNGLRITPADLTDSKLASFYSDEGRRQIIRKGIEGTTMIAWDGILSEQEIDDVYAFIKQFVTEN